MAWRFKVSPFVGAIGLYEVPSSTSTDDSPLTDPFNNLSRVAWHPALRYPGRVAVFTGSLTVPAGNQTNHVLVAHAQGVKPLMIGWLTLPNGTKVPWGGSVPVLQGTVQTGTVSGQVGQSTSASCWLTLGADETHVRAYEIDCGSVPVSGTVTWEVHIFDRAFETPLPNSGPTRMRVSGANVLFESPKGIFSSAKKYLRGAGSNMLAFGKTIGMTYYNFPRPSPSSLREIGNTWSYSSGTGYTVTSNRVYYGTNTTVVGSASNTPGTVGVQI